MKSLGKGIITAALLDSMQHRADPLADQAIADMLGPWELLPPGATAAETLDAHAEQWRRLRIVNQLIGQWARNRDLPTWAQRATAPGSAFASGPDARVTRELIARLDTFVQAARLLPEWADSPRLMRAEQLFIEHGALSCVLLFCASLPECYVIPDIAAVLQAAGHLELHTEHRIRSTAAMIFPVMMVGGLTTEGGSGVAQVLKVRLIHAMVRNLVLRGRPPQAPGPGREATHAGDVPPLPLPPGPQAMHQVLYALGWRPALQGLPCNQEALAYTLLTFGFVSLRSLRRLGLRLRPEDEEVTLHAWNVAGHVLGLERELMAGSMAQAEDLFAAMRARGQLSVSTRHRNTDATHQAGSLPGPAPATPDPRPPLAQALMQAMEQVMPLRLARPFPVLMTRWLCRRGTLRDLGLTRRVPWPSRWLFLLLMGAVRLLDATVRLVMPQFSVSRFIGRVLGYHFMTHVLMNPTRPLQLPQPTLDHIDTMMQRWSEDPHAPRWLNMLEDRLTTKGTWKRQPAR